MKIKKGGIHRVINERDLSKFEKLGYEVVEEKKELTKQEIVDRLDEKGIEYDGRANKSTLLELLQHG